MSNEQRMDCEVLMKKVWRYLRKTLLLMLLLEVTSDNKKKQFLNLVDQSLIDEEKEKSLRSECRVSAEQVDGAFV